MRHLKRVIAMVLSIVMLLSVPMPAMAATNTEDVTFTATINTPVIEVSDNDQTVVVTINTNKDVVYDSYEGEVYLPADFEIAELKNSAFTLKEDTDYYGNFIAYCTSNAQNLTSNNLLTITYTIPANTPAGEYDLGVYFWLIGRDWCSDIWEEDADITATLTIEEDAGCGCNDNPHSLTLPFSESTEDRDYDHYYAWTAPADGTFKVEASGAGEWVLYKDADEINSADGATYSVEMAKDDEIIVNMYHNGQGEAAWTVTFAAACAHSDNTGDGDHNCDLCDEPNVTTHGTATETDTTDATCTADGQVVTTTFCPECGHVHSTSTETIPAGHNWGTVTYSWSADGKTCTAQRVCKTDETHKETEEVTATGKITTSATCLKKGTTTYTANFDAEWAEDGQTTTCQDVALDSTNHESMEFTYTSQGEKHIVKRKCCEAFVRIEDHEYVNGVCVCEDKQTFTITWLDGDGNVLSKADGVPYGTIPSYTGKTPTKTSTDQFEYVWNKGWTPAVVAATESTSYTATFTETTRQYQITWAVGGESMSEEYAYGAMPEFKGTVPPCHTITWDKEIVAVTGETTYTGTLVANHTYEYDCSTECENCDNGHREASHVSNADHTCEDGVCKFGCGTAMPATEKHSYKFDCSTECQTCGEGKREASHGYNYECDKNCKFCDEETRPNAAHVSDAEHTCVDGKCQHCGTPMTATTNHSFTHSYDNNGDTHSATCVCGVEIGDQPHDFANAEHKCVCGAMEQVTYTVNIYYQGTDGTYPTEPTKTETYTVDYGTQVDYSDKRYAHDKMGFMFSGSDDSLTGTATNDLVLTIKYMRAESLLTFYGIDGKFYKETYIRFDETLKLPDAPEYTGMTFRGWQCGEEIFPAGTEVIGPADLIEYVYYAVYDVNSHTVTWTVNGEEYKKTTVNYGEAITAPDYTVPAGHDFSGWDTSAYSTMPDTDLTFDATLTPKTYDLKMDPFAKGVKIVSVNGKTALGALKITHGQDLEIVLANTLSQREDVFVYNYRVGRKITDLLQNTTTITIPGDKVTGNVYIEAAAILNFTVNLNGGTCNDKTNFVETDVPGVVKMSDAMALAGSQLRINGFFERTGHELVKLVAADGTEYEANHLFKMDGDLHLTAQWECQHQATKAVNNNNGTHNIVCANPECNEVMGTNLGHDFVDGECACGEIGIFTLTLLFAEEDAPTYYEKEFKIGTEIPEIPDPERLGYKFEGWWPAIPETMPGHDVEIFAQWSDRIRPTITWNVDGKLFTTTNVDYGDKIQVPAYNVPAGYTLSGWTDLPEKMGEEDLTFNATLIPKTYGVIWQIGELAWTTEATYGAALNKPDVVIPENYYDYRWIDVPETMPAKENLVIEGYWMAKVNVLDFEGNQMQFSAGGLDWDPCTKTVKAGEEVYLNYRGTNFVEGHTLYLVNTADETEKYAITYESGATVYPNATVSENTVFQLTKEANEYKITWTVNGEKIDETTVKYGEAITAPDYTAPEGYTSSGWTVPETMPDEDITLDATLTAKKYTLFLNFNGGTAMSGLGQIPVLTAYGTVLTETISFMDVSITRTGFGFTGWNTKADGTGEAITDENTMPAGEFTLYAQWECLHATTKPGVPNEDGETHSLVCANPECNGAAVEGSAPHTYGDEHVCECGALEPYTVTLSGDCVTMDDVTAYHGQELVVKLHNDTGSSNRGVELRQVRVNGQIIDEKAYTFDENNTLTIPGELITGNVSISAEACVNVTIDINGAEVYLHEQLAQGLTIEQLKAMLAEYCGYTEGSDIVNVYGVTYGSNSYAVLREFLTFFNKPHHNFGGFQTQNGTILEPNEVGAVQIDGDMQLTMLWEIEKFTLTVVDIAGEEHVLEVPYGTNIVGFLKNQDFYAEEYEVNSKDRIGILTFGSWKDFENDEDIQNDAIVTDDMSVYANSWLTGWIKGDLGWGYQIGNVFVSGWRQIDGDWYYLFLDEESGCSYRAVGNERVPYPTEPINGITYKPDADAKAYYESKGETFIDAEEAWFMFDYTDGKFQYDFNGVSRQANPYAENGMFVWHPGVVEHSTGRYFYFIGDTKYGGNDYARNADVYVQKVTKNNSKTIDFVIGGVYTTDEYGQICNYDGIIDMADGTKRYYENARLMVGKGLTKVGENFIYVNRNGNLIVNGQYWVSKINGYDFEEGMYEFDENGYMIIPEAEVEKNGIYQETVDGETGWFYYVDGIKAYNKGLVAVKNLVWYAEDGTETVNSGIIYVRSNGQLATGNYWVTNADNYDGSDVKSGDLVTFSDLGLAAKVKNGIVAENGSLFYYINGVKGYNAGVIVIDGKYYYVTSKAVVVNNLDYWITNVGDTNVLARKYTFAADGTFEPEFVKNGIVDGYYYVNGMLQYAAGVVYLEDEDCYIYVRSNGQLATGSYWATNTNGLLDSKSYDWGTDGKLYL